MKAFSWRVALCTVLAFAFAWPSIGTAQQSSDEQARLHYQVAASYYEQADYESALREFQSAYRLSQRPQLFFNISLCYQQMGNLDEAISFLERYLAEVTEIENRASLEQRLGNLRARREAQQAGGTGDTGTGDTGDTGTGGTGDTGTGGTGGTGATDGGSGAASTAPSGGDSTNVPAIVGFSVAGVGLIAAAIFSGLTLAEDGNLSAAGHCGATRTCTASDVSAMNTYALVADVSWGLSLAGAIVGTIFLFVPTGGSAPSDTASLRVAPVLGTTNGLSLTGAF
ncbi:MAG: tetratricopeptide repeat protein [Sandaracinaceae bacterium]|nr:tetratricopeptide repeat protein [Sandaracinaceae bacterium]